MNNLEIIRAACVRANPEKKWVRIDNGREYEEEPVRLSDVLLAILKTKDGCTKGEMKDILLELAYLWNCFADNLSEQSPETLAFLAKEIHKFEPAEEDNNICAWCTYPNRAPYHSVKKQIHMDAAHGGGVDPETQVEVANIIDNAILEVKKETGWEVKMKQLLCKIFGHPDREHYHRREDIFSCSGGCERNEHVYEILPCPICGK